MTAGGAAPGAEVPVVKRLAGVPSPANVFASIATNPWALWLDSSGSGPGDTGRYAFLACDPFLVLRVRDGRSEWVSPAGIHAAGNPFDELDRSLQRFRLSTSEDMPPFCGGAAGYLGYELVGCSERLPSARRDLGLPDMELAWYDVVVGWDLSNDACWIASTGHPEEGPLRLEHAAERMRQAERWLAGGPPPNRHSLPSGSTLPLSRSSPPPTFPVPGYRARSTFSAVGYARAVRRGIELIRAGDVFQVNLSQRFESVATGSPEATYLALRQASPAPFGAFFRADGCTVMSTSPERFLSVDTNGRVQTRPIKGTRPRHPDPELDRALASELAASEKDRAENLMIVDLLRNDLSRVCAPGSVRTTELFRAESYATVHHLVSTVEGTLREGRGRVDLLQAAFPSGSVTGAPKIRAMEIIAELEPVSRGPYCGALGYLGFGGDMDTSVSIRIALCRGRRTVFHAGGAVVSDSDPSAEYEETLDKARALLSVIGGDAP